MKRKIRKKRWVKKQQPWWMVRQSFPVTIGATPVRAMRIFRLNYDTMTLESLNGTQWEPNSIMASTCNHALAHGHLKPEADCTCGIYACRSRNALAEALRGHILDPRIDFSQDKPHIFSAQIEQWGRVIEHTGGYRSEYARIVPESIQVWPRSRSSRSRRKVVNFLRRKYGA